MLFDKLAGFAERYAHDLVPVLERAYIFDFPGKAHEVLAKKIPPDEFDSFFLPNETVCIEDAASSIIAIDTEKDQVGIQGRRRFIEIIDSRADPEYFSDSPSGADRARQSIGSDYYMISFGEIHRIVVGEGGYQAEGSLYRAIVYDGKEILSDYSQQALVQTPYYETLLASSLKNYMTCLEQVFHFNRPTSFVVEMAPIKSRKTIKGRVTRSHDRSHFTILDIDQIRNKIGIGPDPIHGDSNRKSPKAHARRRHRRILRSDYYKSKKGQELIIPAVWIGPTEAKIGNKFYKIRLDL